MGRYCSTTDGGSRSQMAGMNPADQLEGWSGISFQDPDKAIVLATARDLVKSGAAEWRDAGEGCIELQLATGEIFVLGERHVTRIR